MNVLSFVLIVSIEGKAENYLKALELQPQRQDLLFPPASMVEQLKTIVVRI